MIVSIVLMPPPGFQIAYGYLRVVLCDTGILEVGHGLSQAMAWILVVGHALNPVLNKVSATSVYGLGIAFSKLRKGDPSS